MNSPFTIDGPAVISFSGGRTSGYMLRRVLDEGLQPDVHVLFADTGKERAETYAFVRDVAKHWGVTIHWVARGMVSRENPPGPMAEEPFPSPFEELISERKFLPTPVTRYCTQELKIRPMKRWMVAQGYEHWTNVVGIRADEPRRVAKMRAADARKERWDIALPLAEAGVDVEEVGAFWAKQPFDLQLRPWEGNCDLCFLKAQGKRKRIMRDSPQLAEWWIEEERRIGGTFRADSPSYAQLLDSVRRQRDLFLQDDGTDLADCICHEGTTEAA